MEAKLTVGSLFSGIGGFDLGLERAGMDCKWQVEIDAKCRDVLAAHWPSVKRYEDVRDVGQRNLGSVDIICGGFPCQDVSVAGKRAGLAGKRSGLWFEFHRILAELEPRWVIVENVPGLLSSNGGKDMELILDTLEDLRYVVDCDILDAQYFGVAQRRRRVFIVCQHIDDILRQKTTSSAQTIAQCLIEILGSVLVEVERRSPLGRNDLDFKNSRDGMMRRIRLFGTAQADHLLRLRDNLDAELAKCRQDGERSAMEQLGDLGEAIDQITKAVPLWDTNEKTDIPSEFWSTGSIWNDILAGIYHLTKSFTTSMESKPIAQLTIFFCAKAVLIIAKFITLSSSSCSTYWSVASSALTVIEEYITYARQASSSLFTGMEWIRPWCNFIGQAERVRDALVNTGTRSGTEVLFESTRGAWDSPPSREEGQGVADPITKSFAKHHGCSAGKDSIPRNHIIAQTLQSHAPRYNGDEEALIAFDRPRATVSGDITAPLRHCGAATEGVNDAKADTQCVAFDWQSGGDVRHNCSEHHTSALSSSQTPADCGRWGVRRLTPTECESLQGFPDGWTAGQSDSARYRQLGNAVCVPVAEWIGKRIMETENGHLPNSP